jgi:putative restriction endonuclease
MAWDVFGHANGVASFSAFRDKINSARGPGEPNREIGCSILTSPFFFPRESWVDVNDDFPRSIVRGKFFDTANAQGAGLWRRLSSALERGFQTTQVRELPHHQRGPLRLVHSRVGQRAFRALVTNAYGRRCAITNENTLPVLEAAHIVPVADQGLNLISNGLLLRSDFHRLFDVGLVTVTPEYEVIVSERIKHEYFNGAVYNRLQGSTLRSLPDNPGDRPDPEHLKWHNDTVFEQERRSA